jgi:succinate dehydrogenase/fumarate reductase cytochrome b subunit
MKELFWSLGGMFHAYCHPDSSFFSLREAGFNLWQMLFLAVFFNSLGLLTIYAANHFGLKFARRKFDFFKRIKDCTSGLIVKFGYLGMIAVLLVPVIPGVRSASLVAGQTIGLRYALPLALTCSALRLFVLFFFSQGFF